MATEDDNVNSGALGTLLAVGLFTMIGISLVVTALVRSEMSEEADKKEVGADRSFKDLVAEQTAKLSAPAAFIDRGKGLVSLPIERSMELTVSSLKKDPNSATPPLPPGAKPEEAAPAPSSSGDTAAAAAPPAGSAAVPEGAAAPEGTVKPADEPMHPGADKKDADKKDGEKKDADKKDGEKKDKDKEKEKKDAPKPKPAAPAAPAKPAPAAPAAPAKPAPSAPAPAAPAPPNGQ